MQLSTKALKLKAEATLLGMYRGYRFYEHPVYGDEHFMLAITPEGKVKTTNLYEFDQEDVADWLA